jgi:hypothetical protein
MLRALAAGLEHSRRGCTAPGSRRLDAMPRREPDVDRRRRRRESAHRTTLTSPATTERIERRTLRARVATFRGVRPLPPSRRARAALAAAPALAGAATVVGISDSDARTFVDPTGRASRHHGARGGSVRRRADPARRGHAGGRRADELRRLDRERRRRGRAALVSSRQLPPSALRLRPPPPRHGRSARSCARIPACACSRPGTSRTSRAPPPRTR